MKFADIPELAGLLRGKAPGTAFSGVQCDSRRVRPGDLFVALAGSREDGAKYAASALAKGAVAVLAEAPVRDAAAKQTVLVNDARGALACLAAALNGQPSHTLRVYGITGTNGKTTTAWLLRDMLRAGGFAPGLLTTVQTEYGDRVIPATRTTPDACELQGLLAAMRGAGCGSAVMEVSSHALDQRRTAFLRFEAAAFTNLSQDHLDYHADMATYFQAKQRLFAQLAEERPGAAAVCFRDAGYGEAMAAYLASLPLKRVTCGFSREADLRAEDIQTMPDGSRFTLAAPDGQRRALRVQLAGRYNIANMLCAAGLALDAGVPFDTVAQTLEQARPRWGRLERVAAAVFVDYAHTDDALRNVLGTLRELTRGRLIVVFGCGGNRDRAKRPLMGRACAELADRLVVTSDNPRGEAPMAIIEEILAGIPRGTDAAVEPDRRAAIRRALAEAGPDDVVLVAGRGHEAFQELADRTVPFDDRQVVLEEAAAISAKKPKKPQKPQGPVFDAAAFAGWVSGAAQALPATFCGVTQDSRGVTPGCLYAALRGERFDGHDFVAAAFRAGAAAALVEASWRAPEAWPLIRVADTRRALADAARAWRLGRRALFVGITGSAGKTTTKELCAAMFGGAGAVCATRGNLNNEVGLPLSMLAMDAAAEFGIFELGTNHPGEIARLADVLRPRAAIITAVGDAHIEHFGSREAIAREKGALLRALPADGFAVLSRDMDCFEAVAAMSAAPVVTVSLGAGAGGSAAADFFGEAVDLCAGALRVTERATGERTLLRSGLPGEHNASNLLLAFAAARTAGVAAEAAAESLRGLALPGMRWEVSERGGVTVVNDAYNANPQSMAAALRTFMRLPCGGRRFAVLGDMLELGEHAEALHREVGRCVAGLSPDGLFAAGPDAGRYLADEAVKAGYPSARVVCAGDAEAAGAAVRRAARPGDSVLLKASRGVGLEQVLNDWQV